jgi:nitrite reductase/ring-hydroxylating ferredoxin subunit
MRASFMAEGSNRCLTCLDRRTVLKSGAASAVLAALSSQGCTTSEPLSTGTTGNGDAGSGGTGGAGADGGGDVSDSGGGAGGSSGAGAGGGSGAGAGGSSGAGTGGAAGSQATCLGALAAGNASTVSVGFLVLIGGSGFVLARDSAGLYAMSAICTHQGCGMNVVGAASQQSLYCPCHGSAFSGNGAVTRGPARRPLQHYQIDVAANGDLTVCVGEPVASTTRTPG